MAIEIIPILSTMPAILSSLGVITESLTKRLNSSSIKSDERIKKAEDDLLKTATALSNLAKEVERLERRIKWFFRFSILAFLMAIASIIVILIK